MHHPHLTTHPAAPPASSWQQHGSPSQRPRSPRRRPCHASRERRGSLIASRRSARTRCADAAPRGALPRRGTQRLRPHRHRPRGRPDRQGAGARRSHAQRDHLLRSRADLRRLRRSASDLGAFYDSVADRFGDAAIFSTVAWLVRDEPVVFVLAMVALCGALITSYIRAKAESLGWDATVGIIERPERLMLVIPAIGLDLLPVVLWVLAIGSVVTILQRLRAVLAQVART